MSKPIKRKSNRQLNDELRSIYADRDGKMPDLSRLERRSGSWLTRVLARSVLVLLVFSGIAWAVFFAWNRGWLQKSNAFTTSIEGPSEIRSGERVVYTVRYANNGRVPIAALHMRLTTPPGFDVLSLTPKPADPLSWTLGSLGADSDGSVNVAGIFRSEAVSADKTPVASQTLQAVFNYKPANFNSEFEDIATKNVTITGSAIALRITGPDKVLPGDLATYVITAENTANVSAGRIRVTLALPQGFTITSSEPKTTAPDHPQWDIPILAQGETSTITVNGRFTASAEGERVLRSEAAFFEDAVLMRQTIAEAKTDVLKGTLALDLSVNALDRDQAVDLGRPLRVSVNYTNTSPDTVEGIVLTLDVVAKDKKPLPINWTGVDIGEAAKQTGNSVTWNKTSAAHLGKLPPKATGSFDIVLPVSASFDPAKISDYFSLQLFADFPKVGSVVGNRTLETTPIWIRINSDFKARAEASYYGGDGKAVGSGPLPPEVGSTTSYHIVWTGTNSFHDLKSFAMFATLPADVTWMGPGKASVGTIAYDPNTRVVSWTAASILRGNKQFAASFDVSFKPTAKDAGSFFKLINATTAESIDVVTNERLSYGIDSLTTEAPNDPAAKDKGVVVK